MTDVYRSSSGSTFRPTLSHLPAPEPGAWKPAAAAPALAAGGLCFVASLVAAPWLEPGVDLTLLAVSFALALVALSGAVGGLGVRWAGLAARGVAARHGAVAGLVLAGWCTYPLLSVAVLRDPFAMAPVERFTSQAEHARWLIARMSVMCGLCVTAACLVTACTLAGAVGAARLRPDKDSGSRGWVGPDAALLARLLLFWLCLLVSVVTELTFESLAAHSVEVAGPRSRIPLDALRLVSTFPLLVLVVVVTGRLRVSGGHAWCERGVSAASLAAAACWCAYLMLREPLWLLLPLPVALAAAGASLLRERRREASPWAVDGWAPLLFWPSVLLVGGALCGPILAVWIGASGGVAAWAEHLGPDDAAVPRPTWISGTELVYRWMPVLAAVWLTTLLVGIVHLTVVRLRAGTRERLSVAWRETDASDLPPG